MIAACSNISCAGNTHNNHKIASLRRTSRNHVRFKLHPETTTPCWSGNKASLFTRPPDPAPAALELTLLLKEQKRKEEEEAAARKKAKFEKRKRKRVECKRLLEEQTRKEEEEAAARKKAEFKKRERERVLTHRWQKHATTTFTRNDDDHDSALRELDQQNVVKSDPFILMQGNVVSNADLRVAMEGHARRRMKDAAAIMTILLQEVGGWGLDGGDNKDYDCDYDDGGDDDEDSHIGGVDENGEEKKESDEIADPDGRRAPVREDHCLPPLRSSTDDLLLGLDTTHSNRILLWDDRASASRRQDAKYCSIPTIFFQENSLNITLTRDYFDVGIDVCSPDILARFSDEFDYRELYTQFKSNCISEEERGLQSGRIYAHIMDRGEYAGRPLGDMRHYHRVSMDLMRRWCYPLVPDNYSGPMSNDNVVSYVCKRHLVYKDVRGSSRRSRNRSHVGRSKQLLGTLLLGPKRCRLQRSVFGSNCTLMDDCTIVDSHLWGNSLIESGACLSGVIVCEGVVIKRGARLQRGCVVGRGCIVGEGVRLRGFTRITCAAAEVDDNDDYSGFNDGSSSEDDTSSEDSSECDSENGGEGALVDTTRSMVSLKVADTYTNHDVMGKDRIGRVYVPSPPDDYDSDDDKDKARTAAMELMKSQSIGYDMTLVYRKWQKLQMEDEDDGFSLNETTTMMIWT